MDGLIKARKGRRVSAGVNAELEKPWFKSTSSFTNLWLLFVSFLCGMGASAHTPWAECLAESRTKTAQAKQRQPGYPNLPPFAKLYYSILGLQFKGFQRGEIWLCPTPAPPRSIPDGGGSGGAAGPAHLLRLLESLGQRLSQSQPAAIITHCSLAVPRHLENVKCGSPAALGSSKKLPNIFGGPPALCKPSANSDKGRPCSLRGRPGVYKP